MECLILTQFKLKVYGTECLVFAKLIVLCMYGNFQTDTVTVINSSSERSFSGLGISIPDPCIDLDDINTHKFVNFYCL